MAVQSSRRSPVSTWTVNRSVVRNSPVFRRPAHSAPTLNRAVSMTRSRPSNLPIEWPRSVRGASAECSVIPSSITRTTSINSWCRMTVLPSRRISLGRPGAAHARMLLARLRYNVGFCVTVLVDGIDVDERVRVHELDFSHNTLDRDALVAVVVGDPAVMRGRYLCNQTGQTTDCIKNKSAHRTTYP